MALIQLGIYADAVASYDCALALKPEAVLTWRSRGAALSQLQRFDEAFLATIAP